MRIEIFKQWWPATLARYFQHRLEFIASISLMLLGLWLVYTGLFHIPPLAYTFLSTLAPLWVWGWFLFLIGLLSRVGMYYDNRSLRQGAMLMTFAIRAGLLGAVIYGTNFTSNTIPEHISWLIVSLWAYLRIDAGEA